MDIDGLLTTIGGGGIVLLLVAGFIILCIYKGVRIVPQSEKHVVERFGRLRAVLGPGINFIVPFLDRVAHQVSILERQLPNATQDAITAATSTPRSPRRSRASCGPRSARWNSTRCSRTAPP